MSEVDFMAVRNMHNSMLRLFESIACERQQDTDWVAAERATMHAAVNAERALRGLDAVSLEKFMRFERMAVGHVDYSTKLALYCAELALGIAE